MNILAREKETVCVVVVTYNRKQLLLECLGSLQRQSYPLDAIYLIDNASTDGTDRLLGEIGYIKILPPENLTQPWEEKNEIKNLSNGENIKIHYIRMHKNTGGAGGFYEGTKRGHEAGFDNIWLMDDDVLCDVDALRQLMTAKTESAICACARYEKLTGKLANGGECIKVNFSNPFKPLHYRKIQSLDLIDRKEPLEIESATFEAVLIHRSIIDRIGYPDPNYFIYGDDTDYTYRASLAGIHILMFPKAKIVRLNANMSVSRMTHYFMVRNMILLDLKYGNFLVKMLRPLRLYWTPIRILLRYGDLRYAFSMMSAIFDGYLTYLKHWL
jgi:GT2 family glycosyltransferase